MFRRKTDDYFGNFNHYICTYIDHNESRSFPAGDMHTQLVLLVFEISTAPDDSNLYPAPPPLRLLTVNMCSAYRQPDKGSTV